MIKKSITLASGLSGSQDAFSKADEAIFSLFFPFYDQPKHPSSDWAIIY
jgi:hypothetical protein